MPRLERSVAILVASSVCFAVVAGDLNPPAGPIAPTMKPLDALVPGVCIKTLPGDAGAVHVITEPGLYVLTDDVVAQPGKSAIAVDLNPALAPGTYKVSIDLAGRTVGGVPGSVHALHIRASAPGVKKECDAKKHKDLVSALMIGFGSDAVRCEGDTDFELSGVSIRDCAGHGVHSLSTGRLRVSDITVRGCGGDGVHIEDALECDLGPIEVSDCPGGDGIELIRTRRITRIVWSLPDEVPANIRVADCGGHAVTITDVEDFEVGGIDARACGGSVLQAAASIAAGPRKKGKTKGKLIMYAGSTSAAAVSLHGFDEIEIGEIEVSGSVGPALDASASASSFRRKAKTKGKMNLNGGSTIAAAVSLHGFDEIEIGDIEVSDSAGPALDATAPNSILRKKGRTKGTIVMNGGSTSAAAVSLHGFDEIEIGNIEVSDSAGPALDATAPPAAFRPKAKTKGSIIMNGGSTSAVAVSIHGYDDVDLGGEVFVSNYPGLALNVSVNPLSSDVQRMKNQGKNCMSTGAGGISIDGFDRVDLEGVTVIGSTSTALAIAHATDVIARRVHVADGASNGIDVQAQTIDLSDCSAARCGGAGVRLVDFAECRLDRLSVSSCASHAIHAQSSSGLPIGRCRVTDASCDGNGGHGIFLEATTGGEVARCTLTNNGGLGLSVIGSGHTVHANSLGFNLGGAMVVPVPGNVVGPLVDELTIGANDNPAANYVH